MHPPDIERADDTHADAPHDAGASDPADIGALEEYCGQPKQAELAEWPGTFVSWDVIGGAAIDPAKYFEYESRSNARDTFHFRNGTDAFILRDGVWEWGSRSCFPVTAVGAQDAAAGLAGECIHDGRISLSLLTQQNVLESFMTVPASPESRFVAVEIHDTICGIVYTSSQGHQQGIYCRAVDGGSDQWKVSGKLKWFLDFQKMLVPVDAMDSAWTVVSGEDSQPWRLDVRSKAMSPIELEASGFLDLATWALATYDSKQDVLALVATLPSSDGASPSTTVGVLVRSTGTAKVIDLGHGTISTTLDAGQFYTNAHGSFGRFSWQDPTIVPQISTPIREIVTTTPSYCYTTETTVECQASGIAATPCVLPGADHNAEWRAIANGHGHAIVAGAHSFVRSGISVPGRIFGLRDRSVDVIDIPPDGYVTHFNQAYSYVECRAGAAFVVRFWGSLVLVWWSDGSWKYHPLVRSDALDVSCTNECVMAVAAAPPGPGEVVQYCWDGP